MNWLRDMFIKNFNVQNMASDLMDLIDEDKLMDFIYEQFNSNFTYGELYDTFKDELGEEELQSFLEELGHDYVDLDSLSDEEKEKYY